MRIGGLDRFFQVNVNTLATIPLKGILVHVFGCQTLFARPSFIIGNIYIFYESHYVVIKWMNSNLADLLTHLPFS
jgi:hypothetical protein